MAVLERLGWPLVLIVAPLTSIDLVWYKALADSGYRVYSDDIPRGAGQKVALVMPFRKWVIASKRLAKRTWDTVVIDESQGIKGRSSAQSRAARRFRNSRRRIALSGTPMDGGEIDIWAQMRFVNHSVLGEDWTDFAEKYCYRTGWMNKEWRFNPEKKTKFLNALKPHVFRLTVGFMNLPPIVPHPVPFSILGKQRELYDHMKKHGIIRIDGETIQAPLEVTNRVKREQITGGYILDEDNYPHKVGEAKQRKLAWLLKRLKLPIVVFCQYRHEMDEIERVIKETAPIVKQLHGGIKGKDRARLVDNFQAGKIDALICQTRTGGVSIELTRSSTLVLYSINHSFIDFEQVLFRLYGRNQKETLNVYYLYAEDTVDEEKLDLVDEKKLAAYSTMSHFEKRSK